MKNADRGFGFISESVGHNRFFFHHSSLVDVRFDELRVGQLVRFDECPSDKGPRATNITVIAVGVETHA